MYATVLQDVYLFQIPILENIRLGRSSATDEEVMEAARKAFAHEFITELPEGYQTIAGEGGVKECIKIIRNVCVFIHMYNVRSSKIRRACSWRTILYSPRAGLFLWNIFLSQNI